MSIIRNATLREIDLLSINFNDTDDDQHRGQINEKKTKIWQDQSK